MIIENRILTVAECHACGSAGKALGYTIMVFAALWRTMGLVNPWAAAAYTLMSELTLQKIIASTTSWGVDRLCVEAAAMRHVRHDQRITIASAGQSPTGKRVRKRFPEKFIPGGGSFGGGGATGYWDYPGFSDPITGLTLPPQAVPEDLDLASQRASQALVYRDPENAMLPREFSVGGNWGDAFPRRPQFVEIGGNLYLDGFNYQKMLI